VNGSGGGAFETGGSGSRESGMIADELKILKMNIKGMTFIFLNFTFSLDLVRTTRHHNEELGEVRKRFELVGEQLEDKASKAYTDYHIEMCVRKEALFEIKEQLNMVAMKVELQ
jgi:hypothetical protein